MTTQHTPGPWAAMDAPAVTAFGHVLVAAGLGSTVAHVPLERTQNSRDPRADARLIAAAPDMLAALREIAKLAHRVMHSDATAEEAVARAEEIALAAINKAAPVMMSHHGNDRPSDHAADALAYLLHGVQK